MTVKEAENQYYCEVETCREQFTKNIKKEILIWDIILAALVVVGLILTIVGFTTPPEISSSGYEYVSVAAIFERVCGIGALCLGSFLIIFTNLSFRRVKKQGPRNFLPQIRNLYLNYLKCDDMGIDEKEFYKQKLEDIRNLELVNAIHRASVSASAAIMFSSLCK